MFWNAYFLLRGGGGAAAGGGGAAGGRGLGGGGDALRGGYGEARQDQQWSRSLYDTAARVGHNLIAGAL